MVGPCCLNWAMRLPLLSRKEFQVCKNFFFDPTHSAKLWRKITLGKRRPMDVPYGPQCNAKGSLLPTSWRRPLQTSLGRWNMASWGRLHIALYVTPRNVPFWRLEDVSCRRCEGRVLPTSYERPLEASRGRTKSSLYGSINTAKKRPRDKDFCIRTSDFCLELNNKRYAFLSSKVLSNSIYLSSI